MSGQVCSNAVCWQAGGSTGLLMDLAANEKAVHSDFFNGETHKLYIWLNTIRLSVTLFDMSNVLSLLEMILTEIPVQNLICMYRWNTLEQRKT